MTEREREIEKTHVAEGGVFPSLKCLSRPRPGSLLRNSLQMNHGLRAPTAKLPKGLRRVRNADVPSKQWSRICLSSPHEGRRTQPTWPRPDTASSQSPGFSFSPNWHRIFLERLKELRLGKPSADKTLKSTLKFTPDIQNITTLTTNILKYTEAPVKLEKYFSQLYKY